LPQDVSYFDESAYRVKTKTFQLLIFVY